jgi:TolB-like protein
MADIFLSYSREDRAAVEPLADQLATAGYSLWWDKQLTGGGRFLKETQEELNAARVVLVVWTKTSIESHWVADEASAGRDTGRLLPVSLDGSTPPLGFRQFQVIDFSRWRHGDQAAFNDLLSALAHKSPPSGAKDVQPVTQKAVAAGALLRKPAVLAGIALAAAALAAMIAIPMFGSRTAAPRNERTAFFGFTAASDDPLITEIAAVATEETRAALNTIGLDAAAPGDTQGVELEDQLEQAGRLNARYALAGSVLANGDNLTVTVRLDDAVLRATLWQATLTGGSAQRASLPVQAAARATNLLLCLIEVRPGVSREDASALAAVTRACDIVNLADPQALQAWREAARVAPKSAYAENRVGGAYFYPSAVAAASDRPAILDQARQAFSRGRAIDPDFPGLRVGTAILDVASDRPLAEVFGDVSAAAEAEADHPDRRSIGSAAFVRNGQFLTVGRAAEAVRLGRINAAADPLNVSLQTMYGTALVVAGQERDARRVFESVNRRLPDTTNWGQLAALQALAGEEVTPLVEAAPPGVTLEAIACWQDVAAAVRAPRAADRRARAPRVLDCMRTGSVQIYAGVSALVALGDVDAAFDVLDRVMDRSNPLIFQSASVALFYPRARPMRADPRALPLVKRVGIYQYWLDTRSQPDACDTPEERDIELCRELRRDQAAR